MSELGTTQNEDVNEEVYTNVRNKEKEKERKKKKMKKNFKGNKKDKEQKKKEAKLEVNDDEKDIHEAREKDNRIKDDEGVGELREVLKETNTIGGENMNLRMNDSKDSEVGIRREKEKKHKEEKRVASNVNELLEDKNMEEPVKGQACSEKRENDERKDGKEEDKRKEKKKRKRETESQDVLVNTGMTGGDVGKERELSDGKNLEKSKPLKKIRKGNKIHNDDLRTGLQETITEKQSNESKGVEYNEFVDDGFNASSSRNEMGERIVHAVSAEDRDKDVKQKKKKEKEKKRKSKSDNHVSEQNNDLGTGLQETITEKPSNESKGVEDNEFVDDGFNAHSSRNQTGEKIVHAFSAKDRVKDAKQKKKKESEKEKEKEKKRKTKSDKHVSEQNGDKGVAKTKKDVGTISKNSTPGSTAKRVRFSDHLEVFTLSDDPIDGKKNDHSDGLVRGKRFSKEEDEMVKEAVLNYIAVHDLGDEGLNMVLHCKSHSEVRNCWKEISAALPWRPSESVYHRAHVLFERGEERKWTPEEYELIRSFHEKHGSDWKKLADALGKHRFHVKDTWRRIRLPDMKKGRWSQEEYQNLFDLVNMDLRMRAFEEKKSKHGMLRDDISWEAISNKLGTRSNVLCCQKWYDQLTSPMVAEGSWANTDDYHLIDALYGLDACCIQDVDWDNLLEHRSGDVCRKRWDQMVKHIGEHANKSFPEQVEILSERYSTDVLEARETYESKAAVE